MLAHFIISMTSVILWLNVAACHTTPMFPPTAVRDVSPDFNFKAWKEGMYDISAQADRLPGKVQLGGEIFGVDQQSDETLIIGSMLPIVEHPKYGPKRLNRTPDSTFAIQFQKLTDATWLQRGNFFIVIGQPDGVRGVLVDDVPHNERHIVAQCIHIWKNQGRDIASFPFETGAGYYPLEEKTFCRPSTSRP